MEEPREELKADADERAEAPDFEALIPSEELVRGDRTRDDFFDAVLALDSPTTANDVAELAGHGVDHQRAPNDRGGTSMKSGAGDDLFAGGPPNAGDGATDHNESDSSADSTSNT